MGINYKKKIRLAFFLFYGEALIQNFFVRAFGIEKKVRNRTSSVYQNNWLIINNRHNRLYNKFKNLF